MKLCHMNTPGFQHSVSSSPLVRMLLIHDHFHRLVHLAITVRFSSAFVLVVPLFVLVVGWVVLVGWAVLVVGWFMLVVDWVVLVGWFGFGFLAKQTEHAMVLVVGLLVTL